MPKPLKMYLKAGNNSFTAILPLHPSLTNYAMPTTFDIAAYAPPPGWQQSIKDGAVTYSALQENHYCTIVLYASAETSGDAQQDFAEGWNMLVLTPAGASTEPNMQVLKDDYGWDVLIGMAAIEIEGTPAAVVLTCYSGFGKVFRVLILMNSDFFQEESSAFLNSIVLEKTNVPTQSEIMTALIGKWDKKILRDATGPMWSWTYLLRDEFIFQANGQVKYQYRFSSQKTGTYAVNGNQLTIANSIDEPLAFTFRLETEPETGYRCLYLTDKDGEETNLFFRE